MIWVTRSRRTRSQCERCGAFLSRRTHEGNGGNLAKERGLRGGLILRGDLLQDACYEVGIDRWTDVGLVFVNGVERFEQIRLGI
jgi:hypothetical protein